MARIVCGVAMSHSPLIMTNREAAGERGEDFLRATEEVKDWLKEQRIDAMILISDDHFRSYYYNHMPTFTVGIEQCEGWGDWHLPEYKIPVQQNLAEYILNSGLQRGFDFAFSKSMMVDHGHAQALYFLNPDLEIPVVPIAVNTAAPPLPTMDRCFQLGAMLNEVVNALDSDMRVAVVGSGGLSHWVPIPKLNSDKPEDQEMVHIMLHGRKAIEDNEQYGEFREQRVTQIKTSPVNEEWDRMILDRVTKNDVKNLKSLTYEQIEENGGNGGQEIRNWMVVLGAAQNLKAEVISYQPIPEWVTGMAVVRFLL